MILKECFGGILEKRESNKVKECNRCHLLEKCMERAIDELENCELYLECSSGVMAKTRRSDEMTRKKDDRSNWWAYPGWWMVLKNEAEV